MSSRWGGPTQPAPFPARLVTQQAATVTQAEVQAARDLLRGYGLARPSLAAAIAGALADAREGATVPGERVDVEQHMDVSGQVWRRDPQAEHLGRERVRTAWARALHRQGLRPLGWPPIVVTYHRWSWTGGDPGAMAEAEDPGRADLVRLTIRGQAVLQ